MKTTKTASATWDAAGNDPRAPTDKQRTRVKTPALRPVSDIGEIGNNDRGPAHGH